MPSATPTERKCRKCGKVKPISAFTSAHPNAKVCIACKPPPPRHKVTDKERKCSHCNEVKPISEFKSAAPHSMVCLPCGEIARKQQNNTASRPNAEKKREYNRRYSAKKRAEARKAAADGTLDASSLPPSAKQSVPKSEKRLEQIKRGEKHFNEGRDHLLNREVARRAVLRRSLLNFIANMSTAPGGYKAGWVHRLICAKLEQFAARIERGESPRLMLFLPPRSGKSEIASKLFPAWYLGHHPEHEIIACSYALSLPMEFSKKIKAVVQTKEYEGIFPHTRLSRDSQATEGWRTSKDGGYVAAGVQGPITGKGAHCVVPYDTVHSRSRGILPIADIRVGEYVLGYDHDYDRPVWTQVHAVSTTRFDQQRLLRVSPDGPTVTAEHRVYTRERGYVSAAVAQGLSLVRREKGAARCDLQEVPFSTGAVNNPTDVQHVRDRVSTDPLRGGKVSVSPWRAGQNVLQSGMLSTVPRRTPRGVSHLTRKLRALRDSVDWKEAAQVLLVRVLQLVSRADAALARVFGWVPCLENAGAAARQAHLPPVRAPRGKAGGAPRGPRQEQQRAGEPGDPVPSMSQVVSQAFGDCARILAESDEYVVDLQTGTQNFFANEVLVHNCLIIDDPVKDADEADSETIREKVWGWYGSTARTRLAPGGGILLIMTRWNADDLAGRILRKERERKKEIGELLVAAEQADATEEELAEIREMYRELEGWEVISFEALADSDEWWDQVEGRIVYEPPAAGRPHVALRKKAEALHPDRFPRHELLKLKHTLQPRHWNALYQQNPTPDEGTMFTKSMFRYTPEIADYTGMYTFAAWDLAIGQKTSNDYTVGIVGALDWTGDVYILDMIRARMQQQDIAEAIVDTAVKYRVSQVGIERGQLELALRPALNAVIRDRHVSVPLAEGKDALVPVTDKVVRARPLQGLMQQGKVHFPLNQDWTEGLAAELLSFPNGVYDDAVDSMAWLARMVLRSGRPAEPAEKFKTKRPSWRDKLRQLQRRKHFMAA